MVFNLEKSFAELVYETHIAQVKEEVSQLKSRLMELINLVKDVVRILFFFFLPKLCRCKTD